MKAITKCAAALAAVSGGLLATNANAVNLATDGIGEVAIAPYYTTRDNWQTLINVTNTRDVPIIVKVRFHEGRNSRDVFDFNVALSAFDVFTGVVRNGTGDNEGVPVFVASDQSDSTGAKTCTIPNSIASGQEFPLSPLAFGPPGTTNDDGGPIGDQPTQGETGLNAESAERMKEGYVEFIVMGAADPYNGPTFEADGTTRVGSLTNLSAAIENHKCPTVQQAFQVGNIDTTAPQFGEPINALKFNFTLLNPIRSVESGQTALTLANFYNPTGAEDGAIDPADNAGCTVDRGAPRRDDTLVWDPAGGGGSCRNLITAQDVPDFLEPSLNDAFPAVANLFVDEQNAARALTPANAVEDTPVGGGAVPVQTNRGVDAVSLLLQRAAIINEWSNNPTQNVLTEWVVTMPTKGFYVDGGAGTGDLGPGIQSAIVPGGIGNAYTRQTGFVGEDGGRDEAVLDSAVESLPYAPFAQNFGQQTPLGQSVPEGSRDAAVSCNLIGLSVFDRAEQSKGDAGQDGVIPSPAPPPVIETSNLCFEANVVSFTDSGTILNSQYPLLDSDGNPTTVDVTGLINGDGVANQAGWLQLRLDEADVANAMEMGGGLPYIEETVPGSASGLPVTGFLIKQRTFADATRNYASATDHGYLRVLVD